MNVWLWISVVSLTVSAVSLVVSVRSRRKARVCLRKAQDIGAWRRGNKGYERYETLGDFYALKYGIEPTDREDRR